MVNYYEMQKAIISNLIQNGDLLGKLRLKPEMFTDYKPRLFINYILNKGFCDSKDIYNYARKTEGFYTTDDIQEMNGDETVGAFTFMQDQLDMLVEYKKFKTAELSKKMSEEPENAYAIMEEIREVNDFNIQVKDVKGESASELMEMWLSDEGTDYIKTGFKALDVALNGFEGGQLNVIGGRPSTGKTALLLNAGLNMLKAGRKVSIFSLETTATNVMQRMISCQTGIKLSDVKSNHMTSEEIDKCSNAAAYIAKNKDLSIDDRATVSPQDIRAKAMEQTDKKHVIIIDYLGLMKPTKPINDKRLEVESITRELKIIAKEMNVTILLLSQLSRGVESRQDKRPMLSDFKEAGGIEADANIALLLYRDDYYNEEARQEGGKSDIEVNVAKNKDGAVGKVELEFYKETQRFF